MTISITNLFPVLLGGGLIFAAAAEPKLNSDDLGFVNDAAKGGTTEVALGRLAAQKSSNPRVQAFMGQAKVQEASWSFAKGDTLGRAYLETRSEVVGDWQMGVRRGSMAVYVSSTSS
jgi:hypothetical protein